MLADRVAAHVPFDGRDMARLLSSLRAHADALTMLTGRVPLDNPGAVAAMLRNLRKAGAQDQADALLRRDPAAHVSLKNPGAVAWLLGSLREAGAQDQADALLRRDPAAHAPLDDPYGVVQLLGSLREAGAHDQADALLRRDPAAHAPSTIRTAWSSCWAACGKRARRTRPTRWPNGCLRRECSSYSTNRETVGIGSVSVERPTAPRPHYGAGKTWTYCLFPTAGTVRRPCPSATADPPNPQGKSGQFPVRTSGATLRSPAQRPGSSQPSLGQDSLSGARCRCPDLPVVPRVGVQTYLSCGLNRVNGLVRSGFS